MSFDWRKVRESKRALRLRLAALPIAEKLKMLEELRNRAMQIKRLPRPSPPPDRS